MTLEAKKLLLPLLLACVAVFQNAACSNGEQQVAAGSTLRFSAIPDQNSTELVEKYGRIADYLSKELGVPVEYSPMASYVASVEAFKNGDIQLAWFGGLTHVRARRAVPGARAIAQGKIDPEFVSYFVVNAETGIAPSSEFPLALAGKTFTFGPDSSTSGRLMPEHHIRARTGKSPQEFFAGEALHFSDGHDATAKLVESGTFQAGVLNFQVYDELVAAQKLDPERCVKVWVTPPYPDYNWTAHPSLDATFGAGFVDRLQRALVAMDDPSLLAAAGRAEGIIPASDEDFAPLDELAEELGLIR